MVDKNNYIQANTLTEDMQALEKSARENFQRDDIDSPFDHIPGFTKPTKVAIIDNAELIEILDKEGFEVSADKIQALNFFNSPIGAFQYALYSFGVADFYIVLMVNKRKRSVYGYHVIDFTEKYSLSDDLSNRMKTPSMVL